MTTTPNSAPNPACRPLRDEDVGTCAWRLDFEMLREAGAIRARDPKAFRGAVLTFFGFGGRDDRWLMRSVARHPSGRRLFEERRPLPPEILEPDRLATLPEGTLGREYYEHCLHNDLDPKLISTESEKVAAEIPATEAHRFVYGLHRDSHDFWHVLTGYGIDMAGEAGIIAFTYGQLRNKAYGLICLLNAMMCTRRGRSDVFRTVWQGWRYGRRSPLLIAIEWGPYLARPIEEVRREIGLEVRPDYRPFHMADAPGAPDELPPARASRSD